MVSHLFMYNPTLARWGIFLNIPYLQCSPLRAMETFSSGNRLYSWAFVESTEGQCSPLGHLGIFSVGGSDPILVVGDT